MDETRISHRASDLQRPSAVILVLLGWLAGGLAAQTIRGTVLTDSAVAVHGARVTLLDSVGTPLDTLVTDAAGQFQIGVAPGTYSFRIDRIGYSPTVTEMVEVPEGAGMLDVLVELRSDRDRPAGAPFPLAPVRVEAAVIPAHLAGFERRREAGLGEFLIREDFERWHPQTVSDVIRRTTGFYVRPNPNFGRRKPNGEIDTRRNRLEVTSLSDRRTFECPPLVYLDGAFLGDSRTIDVDLLPIESIEAVETYSRPAQIPPVYNRNGSQCGVVALWTRSADQRSADAPFELGLRYGGSVVDGVFGWGRVGFHFGLPVAERVEVYPALHLVVNLPAAEGRAGNSGWHAQIAIRVRPLSPDGPWYVGAGFVAIKETRRVNGLAFEPVDPDPGYTIFTGLSPALGALRPFVEVQVLDVFTFSDIESLLFAGAAMRF